MLNGRKAHAGRLIVAGAAASLFASALVSGGVVPGVADVAAAAVGDCPDPSGKIFAWNEIFRERGVTMCRGTSVASSGTQTIAYLQIIDMSEGAKVRLVSEIAENSSSPAWNTEFEKRDVSEWEDWIETNDTVVDSDRLFSVMNAGFFTDTNNENPTTMMSLPNRYRYLTSSIGYAYHDHLDHAWSGDKAALVLGSPDADPQQVQFQSFGDLDPGYTTDEIEFIFGDDPGPAWYDATIGYGWYDWYGETQSDDTRTFVGWDPYKYGWSLDDADVFYTMQGSGFTLDEMSELLYEAGAPHQIELDGGGSMQMHSDVADFPAVFLRDVPEVLAVYLAPEEE